MAYTTIDNPELYFQTKLYTGTGSSNAITLDGSENMQPDWVWLKYRSSADSHALYDSVRGTQKILQSDRTNAEITQTNGLSAFGSDGFTIGDNGQINTSSGTYVAWNWKAGGSASNNTDGDITASVSANATAGFSIGSYNTSAMGSASSTYTIGHGLSSAPTMVIVKPYSTSDDWYVYHQALGNTKYIRLNTDSASTSNSNTWGSTSPTSSVFSINTTFWGVNSIQNVFYAFADVKGYSKMGSYTGNGSADGTFVYTGFKPAWVMIKYEGTEDWNIYDNKRNTFNIVGQQLKANTSAAEGDNQDILDFLSNGFKLRTTKSRANGSGSTYIYAAFAENPFVTSTGTPSPAR